MKLTWRGLDKALFKVLTIVPAAWLLGMVLLFALAVVRSGGPGKPLFSQLSPAQLEGSTFTIVVFSALLAIIGMAWALAALLFFVISLAVNVVVDLRKKTSQPEPEKATV